MITGNAMNTLLISSKSRCPKAKKKERKVDGPDHSHKPGRVGKSLLVGKKFACTTGRAGLAIARAYGESLAYLPTHRAPLFLCATTAFGLRKLHGQNSISGAVSAAGGIRVRTAASRGNVSFEL
jgi:hypothetical protein